MLFLNSYMLWSLIFFFLFVYITLFYSFIVYLLPLTLSGGNLSLSSNKRSSFYLLSGLECLHVKFIPLLLLLVLNILWVSNSITAWFGSLVFTSFQHKMVLLLIFVFWIVLLVFANASFLSSHEIYDFWIVKYNFFFWVAVLFLSNSLFSLFFIIEALSALIFLLLVCSTYSTLHFFRSVSLDFSNFLQNNTPHTFIQSILFFYWVSLLSSLNLFVFSAFLYKYLVTFDWYLIEHVFLYLIKVSSLKDVFIIGIAWFFIILSIFLKCGIAPFFIWKPTFFKGMPLVALFFYISFFYFFIFLFFIHFLTSYFSTVFYFYALVTLLFISGGLVTLLFILSEAFFLKVFFAVSSLLNSLLVFLALLSCHPTSFCFFL